MLINPYRFASGGAGADPFFADVGLLLHFDAFTSGHFFDSSSFGLAVAGLPTLNTTDQKFGAGAGEFANPAGTNGAGFALQLPVSAPIDGSTGDWTAEGWFLNRTAAATIYFGTTYLNHLMLLPTAGAMVITVEGTTLPGGTVAIGTYDHVAVVMDADEATCYINGIATGSPTPVSRSSWSGDNFYLGGSQFGPAFPGLMDDFRFTKGVARYTSNFTPPIAPFPDH